MFGLRWFTPSVEVDLCGHATLATAHALRQWGVADGETPLAFHTRSGPLGASYEGERIALDFPAEPPAAAALPECLQAQWPDGAVRFSGRNAFFAFVALDSAEAVADYVPDLAAIAAAGSNALLLTAAGEPGSGADYVLRVFGPNVGIDEDPATGSAQCAAGPWWAEALGRPTDRAGWPPALASWRRPPRPPGRRPRAHLRPRHHRADRPPVLSLAPMDARGVELHALVEGHTPASERETKAHSIARTSSNDCPTPATRAPDRRTSPRRRSSWAGAARCSIGTSGSGSGCSPAATSTPARRRTRPRGGRPWRSWGWRSSTRPAGRASCTSTSTRPPSGHTHLDLRYLLLGADADPDPPPGESQEARWYAWDEAQDLADVALADALPVARAAFEALV